MGVLKYIFHPSRVVKAVEWMKMKNKLGSVGENARIGLRFSIVGAENITIGDNFSGGDDISVWTWKSYNGSEREQNPTLIIGTLLGRGTFVTDNSHGKNNESVELEIPPEKRKLYSKGPVKIGKNVWTGTNVCIMPGVSIGNGVIIGANSVVTHDIPEAAVAVGAPARVVKIIGSESIKHED